MENLNDNIEELINQYAKTYSFNIESRLFPQLTHEQQSLWVKEIEYAVISGCKYGLDITNNEDHKEAETPIKEKKTFNVGDIVSNGKYCFIYGGMKDGFTIQIEPLRERGGVDEGTFFEIYRKATKEEADRLLNYYKLKGYLYDKKTHSFSLKFKVGDKIRNKDKEWHEETYVIKEIRDGEFFFANKWNSHAPIDYILDNFELCRN